MVRLIGELSDEEGGFMRTNPVMRVLAHKLDQRARCQVLLMTIGHQAAEASIEIELVQRRQLLPLMLD